MQDSTINVQIHRFRGYIALSTGTGPTVYIPPTDALAIAKAIRSCAKDCQLREFTKSEFKTFSSSLEGMV